MNILTSLSLNRINDQLRALKSWSQYSVFSFNSKKDIETLKYVFKDVTFIETDKIGKEFGKDYIRLSAFIDWIKEKGDALIINSDIEIYGQLIKKETSLSIYSRNDYDSSISNATLFRSGFDAFFVTKDFAHKVPETNLVMGQCHWDYFLPIIAIRKGVELFSPRHSPIYHKKHNIQYNREKWLQTGKIFSDELKLTGNTINDSNHSYALIKSKITHD